MEECCLCGFAVKSTEEMENHIEDSHGDIFNFEIQQLEDAISNSNQFNNKIQVSTNYQFEAKQHDSANHQFNPEPQALSIQPPQLEEQMTNVLRDIVNPKHKQTNIPYSMKNEEVIEKVETRSSVPKVENSQNNQMHRVPNSPKNVKAYKKIKNKSARELISKVYQKIEITSEVTTFRNKDQNKEKTFPQMLKTCQILPTTNRYISTPANRNLTPIYKEENGNLENSSQKQIKKEKIISILRESYPRASKSRLEKNKIQLNDTSNHSKTAFNYSNAALTHSKSIECSGNKRVSNSRNKNAKISKKPKYMEPEKKQGLLNVVEKEIIDSNFSSPTANLKVHPGKTQVIINI